MGLKHEKILFRVPCYIMDTVREIADVEGRSATQQLLHFLKKGMGNQLMSPETSDIAPEKAGKK